MVAGVHEPGRPDAAGINGEYHAQGEHNDKPLYKKRDGSDGMIYFSKYWKMTEDSSFGGWRFGNDDATGKGAEPPTGKWRSDGYSEASGTTFPTLTRGAAVRRGEQRAHVQAASCYLLSRMDKDAPDRALLAGRRAWAVGCGLGCALSL